MGAHWGVGSWPGHYGNYYLYRVSEILKGAKVGDQLKHVLNPHFGE